MIEVFLQSLGHFTDLTPHPPTPALLRFQKEKTLKGQKAITSSIPREQKTRLWPREPGLEMVSKDFLTEAITLAAGEGSMCISLERG